MQRGCFYIYYDQLAYFSFWLNIGSPKQFYSLEHYHISWTWNTRMYHKIWKITQNVENYAAQHYKPNLNSTRAVSTSGYSVRVPISCCTTAPDTSRLEDGPSQDLLLSFSNCNKPHTEDYKKSAPNTVWAAQTMKMTRQRLAMIDLCTRTRISGLDGSTV